MLYPQNGDRIVTVDSVTSLHLMYKNMLIDWLKPIEMSFGVWSLGDPRNRELGPIRGARIPHGRGNFCGQWPQWLARSRYFQPHSLGGDSGAAFSYQSTVLFCSVLFFSRPRSEGWTHHGRTFSIYPCPLSFWLTLPRRVLSTSWCCPSRPCVAFLAFVHLALFLALSLSPGNSLVSSWCDHSMLTSLLCQTIA